MRKICMQILICMLLPVLLIGCSNGKGKNEIDKAKEVNNLKINPEKAVYTDKRNSMDNKKVKKVVEVTFTIQNTGDKEIGIGAGDFSLFDEEGKKPRTLWISK
ncbi:hypothetical protein ACT7C7_27745 [Bacillus cereus]